MILRNGSNQGLEVARQRRKGNGSDRKESFKMLRWIYMIR
jgi:hypothetical protein